MLAAVLAITAVVVSRPNSADAGSSGPTTEVVYIATGVNFPDALGAAATAALGLGPVLLVQQNAVPEASLTELNRLQPEDIVIVGGTAVVSDTVKTQLEGLAFNPTVTRIAGDNRYETAANLSAASFPTTGMYPRSAHVDINDTLDLTTAPQTYGETLTIDAPAAGWVVVSGSVTVIQHFDTPCTFNCDTMVRIEHVETSNHSREAEATLPDADEDAFANMAAAYRFPVVEGVNTFRFRVLRYNLDGTGTIRAWRGMMTAIWVPFDSNGAGAP